MKGENNIDSIYQSALKGYGLEISGGKAKERLRTARGLIGDSVIVLDCEGIKQGLDLIHYIISEIGMNVDNNEHLDISDIKREKDGQSLNIIIHNLHNASNINKKHIGQTMKGVAERIDNKKIAYTAEEKGHIFIANGDLSGRVRCFDIDE